jgi:Ca-activated chloride channel homolog
MREFAMSTKVAFASLILITFSLISASPVFADGIIIPDPPICNPEPCPPFPFPVEQLVIRYHHVQVTIQDQVAVTHVDQVFFNPQDWQIEGTYVFPIPIDAAVTNFTLWIDGKPVEGQILDADQARQTYENIVSSLRDPALLEYVGQGAVQARIFPIPPQGERRVELEYTQVLPAENGLVRYIYPLNTEKFSLEPLEEVSVSLDIQSRIPLRAVYSPTHDVAVSRESQTHVRVGYEETDVLPTIDFALYYSLGETPGLHLLTYRDAGDPIDPDGFFLMLLAPGINTTQEAIEKDLLLVLDQSGSMDGEKFRQAQTALRYILEHLNPGDRFNIIAFSTGIETYATSLRPANEANEALPWVDRLSAQGSTDINRALLEAASMINPERPAYLIFLTDGLPTEGVIDSQQILNNLSAVASPNLSLFAFGVGYDVDTYLLDSLAQRHHGSSTYVLPGEPLDEILSAFYARIGTPVLTNLSLDLGAVSAYDIYPNPLPDLFSGSQIVAVGRYRRGGPADVTLSGYVNDKLRTFEFPEQVFVDDLQFSSEGSSSIPRLWATRKIGYLLNQIRLQGPDQETIDQIVRLSIRYGIVTPYTSYLVTEEMPLGADQQARIAGEQYDAMKAQPSAPAFGQEAVERAAEEGALSGAESAPIPIQEAGDIVRVVGARTFVLADGVWTDTAFDPDVMSPIKVQFLSPDYFDLVGAYPILGDAFALGDHVLALAGGKAYEVVAGVSDPLVIDIAPTRTPEPDQVTFPPQSDSTPTTSPSDSTSSGGGINCLGGLLPLALLPVGILLAFKHRRR